MRTTSISVLEAEIVRLDTLGLSELRAFWAEHLGKPPLIASTEVTRRWLAWELQAKKLGGLDAPTRRRLRQVRQAPKFAASEHPRSDATPKPGTILTREWAGSTHKVTVLEEGYSWGGRTWSSLSEIATKITGTRWSGPRFFGLKKLACT